MDVQLAGIQQMTANMVMPQVYLPQMPQQPIPQQQVPAQGVQPQCMPYAQQYLQQPMQQAQPQQHQAAMGHAVGQVAGYFNPVHQAGVQQVQQQFMQYQIPTTPPAETDAREAHAMGMMGNNSMTTSPIASADGSPQQAMQYPMQVAQMYKPAPMVPQYAMAPQMTAVPHTTRLETVSPESVNTQIAPLREAPAFIPADADKDSGSNDETQVKLAPPSLERPCQHNEWDDVRTRRRAKILQCRVCFAKWKLNTSIARCAYFLHSKCDQGGKCRMLHVHKKRADRGEREILYEQLKADQIMKAKAAAAAVASTPKSPISPMSDAGQSMTDAATEVTAEPKSPIPVPAVPPAAVPAAGADVQLPLAPQSAPRPRPNLAPVHVGPAEPGRPMMRTPGWGITPTAPSPCASEVPTLISPSQYTPSCAVTPGPGTCRSVTADHMRMMDPTYQNHDVYGMCYRGAAASSAPPVPRSVMSPEEAAEVEAAQKRMGAAALADEQQRQAMALARGHMKSFEPYIDQSFDVTTPASCLEDTLSPAERENEGVEALNEEDVDKLLATPSETLRRRRKPMAIDTSFSEGGCRQTMSGCRGTPQAPTPCAA